MCCREAVVPWRIAPEPVIGRRLARTRWAPIRYVLFETHDLRKLDCLNESSPVTPAAHAAFASHVGSDPVACIPRGSWARAARAGRLSRGARAGFPLGEDRRVASSPLWRGEPHNRSAPA